jgi:nitrite reductase (NADH) large subunit
MSELAQKAWICPICGYIHYGSEPPDECPVCGAMKELFELSADTTSPQATAVEQADNASTFQVVIVGAGIAGVSAAESLRKAASHASIRLVSKEPDLPYYRLNLTRYLDGEVNADDLVLHPESWYTENQIDLLRNTELQALDPHKKELTFQDGSRMTYDKLILTTGANPFLPPFPGAARKNVLTLRTHKDADVILEACQRKMKCVCIGGGLLGLETAGALARRGMKVTILENQAWLLPRQLNLTASKLFETQVKSIGIALHTNVKTREIAGEEAVRSIILEDGTEIPADLVIVSAGVRSNVDLARRAGIIVNQGIVIDNGMKTSQEDVFAAGDVAEHQGILYGTWGPSQAQGTAAGLAAAGQVVEFNRMPRSNTLKVLGIPLFSIGKFTPSDAADQVIDAEINGKYFAFVFHDHLMIGSILLGDTTLSSKVKKVIESQQDCAPILQKKPDVQEIQKFLEDF